MERPDRIPLPPDALMIAVAGHALHDDFARSRHAGPRQLLKDLTEAGIDPTSIRDVLDVGCGAGRFLAGWLMQDSPWTLHGCDYNPLLVDWCQAHLPGVHMQTNALGQPLPYEAAMFDLIYLLSVVTHLTLAEQRRLLTECHRLLRPGGILYLTFHGAYYEPTMFPLVADGAARFLREGFLMANAEVQGTNDCWTLHRVDTLVALCQPCTLLAHLRSLDRGPTDVAAWQDTLIVQMP